VKLSQARAATVAVMALRVAYGAGLIAAPTRLGRRWLGPASATATATAAVGGGSALLSGLLLVAVDR
jgi:hypothetical protein